MLIITRVEAIEFSGASIKEPYDKKELTSSLSKLTILPFFFFRKYKSIEVNYISKHSLNIASLSFKRNVVQMTITAIRILPNWDFIFEKSTI